VTAGVRGTFADGAFFISLAPISNPNLVLSTIAQTLGVPEAPRQSLLHILCTVLRYKHLLLILDNFEQVVSAGPLVLELLQCAPSLHALVTSRTVLHVYGEQEYQVSSLSLPDPVASRASSLRQLTQFEAIRLFMERARAVKPEFRVNDDNAAAVAEICQRLDGLPLAIELAAARIKLMSPQALLDRMAHTLPLLTGGATSLPYRHQTLREAIAWSYDLLDEDEKGLFCSLSVFVGGCTLEAAEAVCPFDERSLLTPHSSLLDALAALVDKNLLRHEEQDDGNPRFSMLETIREFALESLAASGQAEATRRRHADYYVSLSDDAKNGLAGPELVTWVARLDSDHNNLRAALNWLLEKGEVGDTGAAEDALRLLVNLGIYWNNALPSERERWLERALTQTAPEVTPLRIRAIRTASVLARWQGDFPRARAWAEQAVAVAQELGDKLQVTGMLANLATVEIVQGNYSSARTLLESSLSVYREIGDDAAIASTLVNLGEVARYQRDYKGAERYFRESLSLFRALRQPGGVLVATVSLGQVAQQLGDLQEARGAFQEGLVLAQEIDSPGRAAVALTGLAGVLLAEIDEQTEAGTAIQDSLGMAQIARLSGLAAGLLERSGRLLEPPEQAEFDRNVANARFNLGEEAFAVAWEEGKALSLQDAHTLALGAMPTPTPTRTPIPPTPVTAALRPGSDLTPREIEVLQLVAAGLTNPGIAEHLHLSMSTVRTHLTSIFSKINVHTRAAAVRYAFEHRLV
jgi:predicted ATPase/DNA-binding CsgD family transcriptional regulator